MGVRNIRAEGQWLIRRILFRENTGVTAHHATAVGGQVRWQRLPGCGNAGTADGSMMTRWAALGLGFDETAGGWYTLKEGLGITRMPFGLVWAFMQA